MTFLAWLFVPSPLRTLLFWVAGAFALFLAAGAFYAQAHHKGVLSERAAWVERQRVLVAERNAAIDRVRQADDQIATKDAEIDRLNKERAEATPRNDAPGMKRDASRRLRAIR